MAVNRVVHGVCGVRVCTGINEIQMCVCVCVCVCIQVGMGMEWKVVTNVIRSAVNDVKLTGNPVRRRNNDESARRVLTEIDRRTQRWQFAITREAFCGRARTPSN